MSARNQNELIDSMSQSIGRIRANGRSDLVVKALLGNRFREDDKVWKARESLFTASYEFINLYGYKWFRRNSYSIPDFDELLSNTMMIAHKRIDTFSGSNGWTFLAWLLSIGRTARRKELRRLERYRSALASAAFPETSNEPSPDWRLVNSEEHEKREQFVHTILKMIPQEFSELLTSQFFDGYSIEEMGFLYGLPPNTVKTKLRRGKLRLWRILCGMGLSFEVVTGIKQLKDSHVQSVNRRLKMQYLQ